MNKWIFILLIFIFFMLPVFIIILYSVSSSWHFPQIIPKYYDLRSIIFFTSQKANIIKSLISSLFYSFSTVILTFLLTVMPASVFARNSFRFKRILETLLLAPAILPSMIFAMGIHVIFIRINFSDTIIGVILVLTMISYPYMLRALTAGFINYNPDYYACAKNLGAKSVNILLKIELPLILPSIIAGGTVVFLVSFSEYFLVFLIGGGSVLSYSGYIFPFLNSSDRSIASFLTLVFLVIPILLFFLIDRFINLYYKKREMTN